jgi:hypothetical protein
MGKGLGIKHEGVHIAFTGGTGTLVFVDLVAHLIRKNLNLLKEEEEDKISDKNFKFVFYVSFPNRQDSVALELLEGLHELTKRLGMNNFELVKRISNEGKQPRWDDSFIER